MDEQLKRELQEALYGALAAIYQNNKPTEARERETSQETKIEIVVSGDSLSLIKAISEDSSLDNKIAKVANSFEMLNGQLRDFENLDVMGPQGSFTNFVNFISLLATIPNFENLKKLDKTTARSVADFITEISNAMNGAGDFSKFGKTAARSITDFITEISNAMNGAGDFSKFDITPFDKFLSFVSSPDLHKRLKAAQKALSSKEGGFLGFGGTTLADDLKKFLITISSIFNDPEIKNAFLSDPEKKIQDTRGIDAVLQLLNFFTQDKVIRRLGKAHIALRMGIDKAMVTFLKNIAVGMTDPDVQRAFYNPNASNAVQGVQAVIKMIDTLASAKFMAGVLAASLVYSEKRGRKIASFIKGFIDVIAEVEETMSNKQLSKTIGSISHLVKDLTLCAMGIGLMSLVLIQFEPLKTLAVMAAIVVGIKYLLKGIVEATNNVDPKNLTKFTEFVNKTIMNLCLGIVILAGAALVIRSVGAGDVFATFVFLASLVGGVVGLSILASKFDPEGVNAAKEISNMLLALSGAVFILSLSALVIREVGWGDIGTTLAIYGIVIAAAIGVAALLGKAKGLVEDGIKVSENLGLLFKNLMFSMALVYVTSFIAATIPNEWLTKTGLVILAMTGVILGVSLALRIGGQKETIQAIEAFTIAIAALGWSILMVSIAGTLAVNITADHYLAIGLVVAAGLAVLGLIWVANKVGLISRENLNNIMMLNLAIAGLAINMILFIGIAKLIEMSAIGWSHVGMLLAILVGEILVVGILAAISKIPGVENSIKNLVWLLAVMIGLELNIIALVKLSQYLNQAIQENGGLMPLFGNLITVLVGELAILTALAAIQKYILDTRSTVGIAILTVCLAGLIGIVDYTIHVAKKAKTVTLEDIGWLGAIFGMMLAAGGVFAVIGGIAAGTGVGLLAMAGMAALEVLLAGLMGMLNLFITTISRWKRLKDEYGNLEDAGKEIGSAFSGFLSSLVKGWAPAGALLAIVMGIFTGPLLGLIWTIGEFVDIVEQVATMKFISGYDEKGKPIYERVDPGVFGLAAATVAGGFQMFIEGLAAGFRKLGGSGSWGGKFITGGLVAMTISYLSTSIGPIMQSVGTFVDAIMKLITGTYTMTGDDGEEIKKRVEPGDFTKAANAVSEAFGKFITELGKGADGLSYSAQASINSIAKSLSPVMDSVGKFVDAIMAMATGTYTTTDEEGNQRTEVVSEPRFIAAADAITGNFLRFLEALISGTEGMKYTQRKAIKSLSEAIVPIMDSVSKFVDAVMVLTTGTVSVGIEDSFKVTKQVSPDDFSAAAKSVVIWFNVFLRVLGESMAQLQPEQVETMESISKVMKPLMKGVSSFVDSILKLATGRYVDSYDKNGKPIYKTVSKEMYGDAASTLVSSLTTFIVGLRDGLNGIAPEAEEVLMHLSKGGLKDLMVGLSNFSKVISDNLFVIEGYDKNGKPIFMRKNGELVKTEDLYPVIAGTLATSITKFVTTLRDGLVSIEKDVPGVVKALKNILGVAKPVGEWGKMMKEFDVKTDYDSITLKVSSAIVYFASSFSSSEITSFATDEKKKELSRLKTNAAIILAAAKVINNFGSLDMTKAGQQEKEFLSNLATLMSATLPDAAAKYKSTIDQYTKDYGDLADRVHKVTRIITKASAQGYMALAALVTALNSLGPTSSYIGIDLLQTKLELLEVRMTKSLPIEEFANKISSIEGMTKQVVTSSGEIKNLDEIFRQATGEINQALYNGTSNFENTLAKLLADLTKLDTGIKASIKTVKKFGKEFEDTVDKIEKKLKKNEGERNRMLKDLTTHLDTIGKKLQVISSGLKAVNESSMDKVEQLGKIFMEMQQQQMQMLIDANIIKTEENPNPQPAQPAQPSTNNVNVSAQQTPPPTYFGEEIRFVVTDATRGELRGMLQRMV